VNDDEHSLFIALRIGYCYVAYNVWNKTSESIFQITRGRWGTKYVMEIWSDNFTAAFSLVSLWLLLFLISRELRIK